MKTLMILSGFLMIGALGSACASQSKQQISIAPIEFETPEAGTIDWSTHFSQRHLNNLHMCVGRNADALRRGQRLEIDFSVTPVGKVNQIYVASEQARSGALAACVARTLTWIQLNSLYDDYHHLRLVLRLDGDDKLRIELQYRNSPTKPQGGESMRTASGSHALPAAITQAVEANKDR
jgi:hypothetical protein